MKGVKVKGTELLLVQNQVVDAILEGRADFQKRVLYLMGGIDEDVAMRFVVTLSKMDEKNGLIRVVLMSTGGEESAGWAIYDIIRQARNQVVVDAVGSVWSMAVPILQAGFVRRMSRETRLMVHSGSVKSGRIDQKSFIALGEEAFRTNLRYQQVLAERTGIPLKKITEYCGTESFFSAEEALIEGFVDAIIPYSTAQSNKKASK